MMPFGADTTHLRWHALPPLWVIVLILVPAVFLAVRFVYKREAGKVGRRPRITMGVLRSLAILLILMTLFGPYAETIHGEHFDRHLILLIDTSRSMGFRDGYQNEERADAIRKAAGLPARAHPSERTRIEILRGVFRNNREFIRELAGKFSLHVYTFDESLAPLVQPRAEETAEQADARLHEELKGLQPNGAITRIGVAIRDLVRSFGSRNESVAGVVLLSDGRHTGGAPDPVEEARRAAEGTAQGIPIYPVEIGDRDAARNVGVSRVDAPDVVLAGDEVAFTVSIHARGYEGRPARVEAHILGTDGKIIETPPIDAEPFELPPDKNERGERETVDTSFRLTFDTPGVYDMKIGVPKQPGEAIVEDNYQRHAITVVKQKVRVLLAAGEPNYDYRFLKELLLRAEETIEANVILFSAEPEWPQEASNGVVPIRTFPDEKAALAEYDVVILMDVGPRHLSRDEDPDEVLDVLENWVAEGGGLVLQAGKDSIPERYRGTKMMTLLPVVPGLAKRTTDVREHTFKRFRLTPAGRTHPIMRVLTDPTYAHEFWDGDDYETRYNWYAPVERAKSSATVLAVRRDEPGEAHAGEGGKPHALVALQEYGSGKVLWLGTDELWRMRKGVENLYYWRFWSGIIRHLATYRLLGGNRRIKIFLDRNDGRYRVGDSIEVVAKYLDENFDPVVATQEVAETMTRTLKLRSPNGNEKDIALEAVIEDPPRGIFEARITAGKPGTYRLYAEPERDEEPAQRTFVVEETTIEMRDPLMDHETMVEIARVSGGSVLSLPEFLEILTNENERKRIKPGGTFRTGERTTSELWDKSWVLLLFTAIMAVEWILRKRNLLL